jgi:phospholipid transport system transporter-binding protein
MDRLSDGRYGFSGELGFDNAGTALRETLAMLRQATGPVVIDLAGVQRADSAGVALLVELVRDAGTLGIGLRFANLPQQVEALAAVSGITAMLPRLADSPDRAVRDNQNGMISKDFDG